MMVESLPPIWVINLKRSVERRKLIEENLQQVGLTYEITEAVDGFALSDDFIKSITKPIPPFLHRGNQELTPGEVGCALSHYKCWQRMIEEDIPEALILEDDLILSEDFVEILNRRSKFPSEWERINFCIWGSFIPFGNPIYKHYKPSCLSRFDIGAYCYLLKKSAAEKLLKHTCPINMPVDEIMGRDYLTECSSGSIYPPTISLRSIISEIRPFEPLDKKIIDINTNARLDYTWDSEHKQSFFSILNFYSALKKTLWIILFPLSKIPNIPLPLSKEMIHDRYYEFMWIKTTRRNIKKFLTESN